MTRVTTTFLILLLVATLTLGIAWRQTEGLAAGRGHAELVALLVVSGSLLLIVLIGLGRILYVTTTRANAAFSESNEEVGHG